MFETATGRRLAYGNLVAEDATGSRLGAHLELGAAGTLALRVDDAGAAYPLAIDPLLTATADTQLESDQANALLGTSVAGAGDVNGDGYADVIVGRTDYDAGQRRTRARPSCSSAARRGSRTGTPRTAAAQLESNQAGAYLGWQRRRRRGRQRRRLRRRDRRRARTTTRARATRARPSSSSAARRASPIGSPATAARAARVGPGGRAPGLERRGGRRRERRRLRRRDRRRVRLRRGPDRRGRGLRVPRQRVGNRDGQPERRAAAQLESNQAGAQLGWSVAGAGDVNGDGYADVIVGADAYDAGQTDEGAAFVFLGSASGIASGQSGDGGGPARVEPGGRGRLGRSVAGAGDVNGDGYARRDRRRRPLRRRARPTRARPSSSSAAPRGSRAGTRRRPRPSSSRTRRARAWAGAWRGPGT